MKTLVFDSAPLCAFARAERLALLRRLVEGYDCVTTRAVVDEIRAGVLAFPRLGDALSLQWLRVEPIEDLRVLRIFAQYARRLGSGQRDVGEATVLAWAEAHEAIAFTDDQPAVQAGRDRGVRVQRTLALVCRGVRLGMLSLAEAEQLVAELMSAGARFPMSAGEFVGWARDKGLLG